MKAESALAELIKIFADAALREVESKLESGEKKAGEPQKPNRTK
jgi:hypothetical protein